MQKPVQKHYHRFWSVLLLAPLTLAQFGSVPVAPKLMFPDNAEVLDNGCLNLGSGIYWTFIWSEVPNATSYHLRVMGANAINPVIDNPNIRSTDYISKNPGSYIVDQNRLGWRWRVRAMVNGQWSSWSEERSFDVEPLDTDCRRNDDRSL